MHRAADTLQVQWSCWTVQVKQRETKASLWECYAGHTAVKHITEPSGFDLNAIISVYTTRLIHLHYLKWNEYTLLYPSAVASFLMPNHLAGSTGSLYKEEFFISSGNRLVSFARGCKRKDGSQTLSHSSADNDYSTRAVKQQEVL